MVISPPHRHFLGVERSATGRAWRDRLDDRGNARSLAIAQRHGMPELLARIVAGRNVEAEGVEAYLDPTIKGLMPDPEKRKLCDFVIMAHRLGTKVRLWASPEKKVVWDELLKCGVDLINTDHLVTLRTYLNSNSVILAKVN